MTEKTAFTLAETLITLAIIGIVAAMTLPTLIQKYKEKQTIVRLKQTYSMLEQAYLLAVNEYGPPSCWGLTDIDTTVDDEGNTSYDTENNDYTRKLLLEIFTKYLKTLRICNNKGLPACFYSSNTTISSTHTLTEGRAYSAILMNGVGLVFVPRSSSCTYNVGTTEALQHVCADIWVDIDGPRGENAFAKDFFRFHLTEYGIVPKGTKEDTTFSFASTCYTTKTSVYGWNYGESCTAWVIYNENMDYLHCDDLSWEGKHKCD